MFNSHALIILEELIKKINKNEGYKDKFLINIILLCLMRFYSAGQVIGICC